MGYCVKCGNELKQGEKFCTKCGNSTNTANVAQRISNTIRCSCGSTNVNVQVVNEMQLVNKHHGIIWWLLIGWWWLIVKWIFFTIPALLIKIFGHKKQKIKNKTRKMAICQSCGRSWYIK